MPLEGNPGTLPQLECVKHVGQLMAGGSQARHHGEKGYCHGLNNLWHPPCRSKMQLEEHPQITWVAYQCLPCADGNVMGGQTWQVSSSKAQAHGLVQIWGDSQWTTNTMRVCSHSQTEGQTGSKAMPTSLGPLLVQKVSAG